MKKELDQINPILDKMIELAIAKNSNYENAIHYLNANMDELFKEANEELFNLAKKNQEVFANNVYLNTLTNNNFQYHN